MDIDSVLLLGEIQKSNAIYQIQCQVSLYAESSLWPKSSWFLGYLFLGFQLCLDILKKMSREDTMLQVHYLQYKITCVLFSKLVNICLYGCFPLHLGY